MVTTSEKPRFRAVTRIIGAILFSWCACCWNVGLAQSAETAEVTAPEASLARENGGADGDHLKPEAPQSTDGGAARTHDLRDKKLPEFAFSAQQTDQITRNLWAASWVKQYSWLLIGDAGPSGEWRFRVFPVGSRRHGVVVGEGVVRFAEDESVTASLSLPRGERDYTVVGFDATVNEEWFDVRAEAASVAVLGAFAELLPADSGKDIYYAWVFKKKDVKRWPLCFVEFYGGRTFPGYAEVDSDSGSVFVYPLRESVNGIETVGPSAKSPEATQHDQLQGRLEHRISSKQVSAISRCLLAMKWIQEGSWLVIADGGGSGDWPLQVLSISRHASTKAGEGELQFQAGNRIVVSIQVMVDKADHVLEGFEPSINEEWFDVREEAASVALRETFTHLNLLPPGSAPEQFVCAWVKRKKDVGRWPIWVFWFMGNRIMSGLAEIDAEGTMVLIFPGVMM